MGLKAKCNPITLEHISMDIEKERAQAKRIYLNLIYAQIKSWKPFPRKKGSQEELCARNFNPRKRKRLKIRIPK